MRDRKAGISSQDGIVVGNIEDKENLKNPVSRRLVRGFDATLFKFLQIAKPRSLHEVGCGEGRLTRAFAARYDMPIRASDLSKELIQDLREKNISGNIEFTQ